MDDGPLSLARSLLESCELRDDEENGGVPEFSLTWAFEGPPRLAFVNAMTEEQLGRLIDWIGQNNFNALLALFVVIAPGRGVS